MSVSEYILIPVLRNNCIDFEGMLNLTTAMMRLFCTLLPVISILVSTLTLPQNIVINYPQSGQSVQGIVEIKGSLVSDNFMFGEIYYTYTNSNTNNWFLIRRFDQPANNEVLARWDTTTITDGEYSLKVVLVKNDNSIEELIINPIFVRNYSPEPTISFTPIISTVEPTPGNGNLVNFDNATPLPPNPAAASTSSIQRSILVGIILVVLAFAGLMGYRAFFNHNHLQ